VSRLQCQEQLTFGLPAKIECPSLSEHADMPFEQRYIREDLGSIGVGTYGEVHKVKDVTTGKTYALKNMKLDNEGEGLPSTAIREVSFLRELEHPNVVQLVDVHCATRKLCLLFELLPTDLKKYMKARNPLSPATVKTFMYQLVKGTEYCHSRRIMHRDLKPANLLIGERNQLKIADFGLARAFSLPIPVLTHEVVTVWYRPPEILLNKKEYGLGCDVWSMGAILAEMARGSPLFAGDSEIDTLFKIFRQLGTPHQQVWPGVEDLKEYSPSFPQWRRQPWDLQPALGSVLGSAGVELLDQCLVYNPPKRISARRALLSRYFDDAQG